MINNIHTLKEKQPQDFSKLITEQGWYEDEGDLCYDLGVNGYEFTLVFKGKSNLSNKDYILLNELLRNVVDLDFEIANKTKPYKDYEFELSYITIGKTILFSYCGINVNSTWESEFKMEGDENTIFKSVF